MIRRNRRFGGTVETTGSLSETRHLDRPPLRAALFEQFRVRAMDYDPADHVPTGRQVAAAWVACLAIAALMFAGPVVWHDASSAIATAHARMTTTPHSPTAVTPALCEHHDPHRPAARDPSLALQPS
jgi:hypothetical protein